MMRPASQKERAIITSFRTPTRLGMAFFALICVLLAGITFFLFSYQVSLGVGVFAAFLVILSCGVILKRGFIACRDAASQQVMDSEGRIEKVVHGKGNMVIGLYIAGVRYHVMDAEPVAEGTKVKIAYLPRSRRILTLERLYDFGSPDVDNRVLA